MCCQATIVEQNERRIVAAGQCTIGGAYDRGPVTALRAADIGFRVIYDAR
jgi:hypothetical protein